MQIFVKTLTGKTITLEVESSGKRSKVSGLFLSGLPVVIERAFPDGGQTQSIMSRARSKTKRASLRTSSA